MYSIFCELFLNFFFQKKEDVSMPKQPGIKEKNEMQKKSFHECFIQIIIDLIGNLKLSFSFYNFSTKS